MATLRTTKSDVCRVPPEGWWCSRGAGHDGPCAARRMGGPLWNWYKETADSLVLNLKANGWPDIWKNANLMYNPSRPITAIRERVSEGLLSEGLNPRIACEWEPKKRLDNSPQV